MSLKSDITPDGQSASVSWCQAYDQIFAKVKLLWGYGSWSSLYSLGMDRTQNTASSSSPVF
jgi:hypothetical protein